MKLLRSLDERYNTIDTVEGLVAQCGEMEVGLAAELVSNGCDTTVLTGKEVIARIKEALLTAQKLLRD